MSHWTWTQPITIRMQPKPVGSLAPAKPEQGVLTAKPAEPQSHAPKPEDEQ